MKTTALSEVNSHINGFRNGSAEDAYAFFGAHPVQQEDQSGWLFRVWAPHARSVHVAGPFNGWTADNCPMRPLPGGVWECFVPGLETFDCYQYIIETEEGETLRRSDPFAFHAETRPGVCSKLFDLSGYPWNDEPWLKYRLRRNMLRRPLNIYELHLGSWRRTGEGTLLSYRDTAKWLVPYVKEMGFSAVEFFPVTEHPEDESWGYDCTGFFAPTSRFGTPHDFMYLVDQLHQAGVMVLLDWTPAVFSAAEHGLARFDGAPLYEYDDPIRAEAPDRDALRFDPERPEVRSFLTSCALFWAREYHIDGLRMTETALALYPDGDRQAAPGAAALFRHLNERLHAQSPAVLTVGDGEEDLGFTFQWNLRWASGTVHYAGLDPIYRQYNHRDITETAHAFDRRSLLPLSHEALSLRGQSLTGLMPGADGDKLAGVRVFYLYQLTHPGKKLTMMGSEFGQLRPWDHNYSLDWHLLGYQTFRGQQAYFRAANRFYLASPPLWAAEGSKRSFEWVCKEDCWNNVIAYLRRDEAGEELLVVLNFSPMDQVGYRLGVPAPGVYQAVFHTDSTEFGGGGRVSGRKIPSSPLSCNDRPNSILVDLPPLSGVVLRLVEPSSGGKPKFR